MSSSCASNETFRTSTETPGRSRGFGGSSRDRRRRRPAVASIGGAPIGGAALVGVVVGSSATRRGLSSSISRCSLSSSDIVRAGAAREVVGVGRGRRRVRPRDRGIAADSRYSRRFNSPGSDRSGRARRARLDQYATSTLSETKNKKEPRVNKYEWTTTPCVVTTRALAEGGRLRDGYVEAAGAPKESTRSEVHG